MNPSPELIRLEQALVDNPNIGCLSDGIIAACFGIHPRSVQRVRMWLESSRLIPAMSKRMCADGKERDVARIGKRTSRVVSAAA
jgi:hypothetical protein